MDVINRTGVYKLVNKLNGKVYVGSAARTFKRRWEAHRNELNGNRHHNLRLQAEWIKFGEASFEFKVLQFCLPEKCLEIEQKWLDRLRPWESGYNIAISSTKVMLGRTHSEVVRKNQAIRLKGVIPVKATEAAALVNRGKSRPEEVRQKISKAKQGVSLSDDHRQSIKRAHWSTRPDAKEIAERSAAKQRGRKQNPETIEKRRQANLRAWARKKALVSN